MSEELQALEDIVLFVNKNHKSIRIIKTALNRLEELEKVLEIIKNKHLINLTFADDFDVFLERNNLTETEFSLLKEYLKWVDNINHFTQEHRQVLEIIFINFTGQKKSLLKNV